MKQRKGGPRSLCMLLKPASRILVLGLCLALAASCVSCKPKKIQQSPVPQTEEELNALYTAMLSALRAEIDSELSLVDEGKKIALEQTREEKKKAEADAIEAQKKPGSIANSQALINHAKGKWIRDADIGIAKALAVIDLAKTPTEREAAEKELTNWQANREEGVKALSERMAAFEKAKQNEPEYRKAHESAQAALTMARENEMAAASALLAEVAPVVATDKLDAKLVKAALLAHATPGGLAEFASQGAEKAALVRQLLGDPALMKDMLVNGGARFGEYGRAMEIYTAIGKASRSHSGSLQRLALGTALEHARPIEQSSAKDITGSPSVVDPVKRYLHYEKAFLEGELDPAFKNLTAWEYRHVVNSDAPDEILAWGREMLRNYRPDHIYFPNYGWRYVNTVRTEVPYGSENVKYDDPSLHPYKNIICNGGVCGRRAFFGRFILRCFGIPTWGVTQKAHAALSHWTPDGWVVNLGAGYNASWWDKDEVPLSGAQFLQETQARAHGDDYMRVLRAEWVSRILGEEAYNDRKKIPGGFWSGMANYMSSMLASKKAALGPLGQELGEANEEQKVVSASVTAADQQVMVAVDGSITIPSVANKNPSGKASAMKSFGEGMQLHALGGYKTQYEFDAPKAGNYQLSARVVTVQAGQQFVLSVNDAAQPVETDVPYTLGMWEYTKPVEVTLVEGKNILNFELKPGRKGVTIKDFLLKPVK